MRRWWGALIAAVLALVTAAACSDSDSPTVSPTTAGDGSTPTSAAGGPATTVRPGGPATLRAEGVRLLNSEESDNGLRIGLDSAAPEVTVVVKGGLPSPNRIVMVCPAVEVERRVPVPGSACQTPADGAEVKVPHGTTYAGVEIVQVGVSGPGATGNALTVGEITITYPARTREVRVRLPTIPAGGVRPSFRLSPAGAGPFRATATWTTQGPATTAELTFEVGTRVLSKAEGPPGLLVNGNVSPPEEGVVRFRNAGLSTMVSPLLTALFP